MNELKTTQDLVFGILKEYKKARSSDNFLFYKVYQKIASRNGIDLDSMYVPIFLLQMKELGFPSIETIRRTRQKIQAIHPELCGSDDVEAFRELEEEEFRNYARKAVL